MNPWDGASRWINTLLLVIVGFVGFDTLFRLLEANERNVIVGFTRTVGGVLLAPFDGMFEADQDYLLTSLIAVLGYALVAGIAMAVIRSIQASRRRSREAVAGTHMVGRAEPHPGAGTQPLPGAQPTRQDYGGADGTEGRGWQRHAPQRDAPTQDLGAAGSETERREQQDAKTERLPADSAAGRPPPGDSPPERNGGMRRS